jgi:hypothetical protein
VGPGHRRRRQESGGEERCPPGVVDVRRWSESSGRASSKKRAKAERVSLSGRHGQQRRQGAGDGRGCVGRQGSGRRDGECRVCQQKRVGEILQSVAGRRTWTHVGSRELGRTDTVSKKELLGEIARTRFRRQSATALAVSCQGQRGLSAGAPRTPVVVLPCRLADSGSLLQVESRFSRALWQRGCSGLGKRPSPSKNTLGLPYSTVKSGRRVVKLYNFVSAESTLY